MSEFPFKFSNDSVEDIRKLQSQFAEERNWDQFHTPRNLLLALVGEVGELADIFYNKDGIANIHSWTSEEKVHLGEELSDVSLYLIRLSQKCLVDLPTVTIERISIQWDRLNKDGNELCLNGSEKSESTNDSEINGNAVQLFTFSEISFETIKTKIGSLDGGVVNCLQNDVLALVKEVGELSELFQWKGEVEVGLQSWNKKERGSLEEKCANVFLNLICLSNKCHIDLPDCIRRKIIKNAKKYPIKLVHGCSKKYTQYKEVDGKLVVD